jgi:hypothetical protein
VKSPDQIVNEDSLRAMSQAEQLVRKFDFTEAIVGLRKDGIVHVYFKPGTEITVALQEKMLIIYHEVAEGIQRPFIFEAAEYCSITREAKENAIRIESETPCKASAVFVNNFAYRMIAEFYYKFNKPRQPYKVVSEFSEGIRWLLEINKQVSTRNNSEPMS